MKANEIRAKRFELGGVFIDLVEAAKIEVLQEIAAQLAELNEPPAPQWVCFETGDDTHTFVDVSHIRQVVNMKRYVVLNNPFERTSVTVYEPLGDVLAKLGIPLEASNAG